eukprot:scaffold76473_cov25-Tisochrysis_lutea.AAC.4
MTQYLKAMRAHSKIFPFLCLSHGFQNPTLTQFQPQLKHCNDPVPYGNASSGSYCSQTPPSSVEGWLAGGTWSRHRCPGALWGPPPTEVKDHQPCRSKSETAHAPTQTK